MSAPAKTAARQAAARPPRPSSTGPTTTSRRTASATSCGASCTPFSQEVERELEPSGLTNAQWVPLLKLYMGSASTVAELARECQLDAGGMTRLLDRLETKGLVRRVRSSEDRRVVNLELTEPGRAAAKHIPADAVRRAERPHARLHRRRVAAAASAAAAASWTTPQAIQAEREGQQ